MKVWEYYSDSSKWTQNVLARNKKGQSVEVHDESAVSRCFDGAIQHCYPLISDYMYICELVRCDGFFKPDLGWTTWNDKLDQTFDIVYGVARRLDI